MTNSENKELMRMFLRLTSIYVEHTQTLQLFKYPVSHFISQILSFF